MTGVAIELYKSNQRRTNPGERNVGLTDSDWPAKAKKLREGSR